MSLQIKNANGEAADGDKSAQSCQTYTPTVLLRVRDKTRPTNLFARNALFTNRVLEDREEFRIESYYENQQMAPEVCCHDEAPIAAPSHMIHAQTVSPSYVKLKTSVDPCKKPMRLPGDDPWMSRSLRERLAIRMAMGTRFLERAVQLREEYMMWQILRESKYTTYDVDLTTGDYVPKNVIDFKRAAALGEQCFTWGKDVECILEDVQTMLRIVSCEGNAKIDNIMLGWQACDAFRFNKEMRDYMRNDTFRNNPAAGFSMNILPSNMFGNVEFITRIGNVNFWCNSDFWIDKKNQKHYWVEPDEMVGWQSEDDEFGAGLTRIYGPIKHCDEMVPQERHLESWKEIDPSKRWEKIESSPLPIVQCANSTFRAKIKIKK